jgi:single-stranded-DNA-specific exonuclease
MQPLRDALLAATVVVPHTDADGLAAGALALRARGETASDAILLGRGETPFTAPLPAGAAVLDWGVRQLQSASILVDHHAPEWEPGGAVAVLSGYGEEPETSTAPLVRRLVSEQPAWLAAVGAVGDLGEAGFALPEAEPAPRAAVMKLVGLVNAPRRLRDGPVRTALRLLVEHDTPEAALADPNAKELLEAKRAWQGAYRDSLRVAPRVGERVAVIRLSTPYQVHPLVAAAWRRRLAPRVVLVANDAYLPGRVNFAVRGGDSDLRALLHEALPEAEGEFAHGHDRATGGSLAPEQFELLLDRLGVAA